jgi:hypothetical protein
MCGWKAREQLAILRAADNRPIGLKHRIYSSSLLSQKAASEFEVLIGFLSFSF